MIFFYYVIGFVASAFIGYKLCTECGQAHRYGYSRIREIELSTNNNLIIDQPKENNLREREIYNEWEFIENMDDK